MFVWKFLNILDGWFCFFNKKKQIVITDINAVLTCVAYSFRFSSFLCSWLSVLWKFQKWIDVCISGMGYSIDNLD